MSDKPKVLWLGPEGGLLWHWSGYLGKWTELIDSRIHNKTACAARGGACAWERVPSQGRHVPIDHKLCQGEIRDHDWVRYDAERTWLWTCKLCGATSGNPFFEPEPFPPCPFCSERGHSLQECKLYRGSKTAEDPSRTLARLASAKMVELNLSYSRAADYVLATHPELAKAREEFIDGTESETEYWRARAEKAEAMSASIRSMCDAQNETVRKRAEDAESECRNLRQVIELRSDGEWANVVANWRLRAEKADARIVELKAVISGLKSRDAMRK